MRKERDFQSVQDSQNSKGFSWCPCLKKNKEKELDLNDQEEVDPEAEERKRQAARAGWAKVRTIVKGLRMQKLDNLAGLSETKFKPKNYWDYQNYIILPNSMFKTVWRIFIAFILFYQQMTFPYRFAFGNNHRIFMIIDGVIDVCFLFDFLFHFFYSYIDKRQRLVNTFRPIFMKYLLGTMLFDIVALYPYYFLADENMYALKIFRYIHIGDMLSGICECLDSFFLKVKNNMNFALSITRIIHFAILLGLIGQIFGSIWYYLGDYNIRNFDEGWIKNFLVKDGKRADQTTIYITSIYWVFTTLSTLGYGDYYPVVRNEYLFTMSIEFMGVFLFAYMMGNINDLIEKLDDDHNEYIEDEFEVLDQWLMKIDRANPKKRLDQERVDRIRGSLKTYWEKDHSSIQKDDFLHQLPVEIKSELIDHLFKNFMDNSFRIFFSGLEEKFKQEIVVNLSPRKYQDKEEIISIDSGAKNLYFIVKGKVSISSKDKIMDYVELAEGSYFGDYLIFFRLRSSNAFIAVGEVELMCIKKRKFLEICEMFATSAKQLKYRAFLRRKFVRKQKKAIEDINKMAGVKEDLEHKNKLLGQLTGGQLNLKDKPIPEIKIENSDEEEDSLDEMDAADIANAEENATRQKSLLAKSQELSNKLDVLSDNINVIESDFNKKLKSLKSHVDFLSHFEEYFKKKAVDSSGDKQPVAG